MRTNQAFQNSCRFRIPVKLRSVFVNQNLAVDMITDGDPGSVMADTDPIGNLECFLDESPLVFNSGGVAGLDNMR